MSSESVFFNNRAGHTIQGYLDHPQTQRPGAWVLFAHCFTCSGNFLAARRIADALVLHGLGVFRFDFTGLGGSEGEFGESSIGTDVTDLEDAAAYLEEKHQAPAVIIGHSLGGVAALLAAARLPSIRAVATVGTPADAAHVTHLFKDHVETIKNKGTAEVWVGGRPFSITRAFLEELQAHPLEEVLANLKKPVLFLHAPRDQVVGIENAAQLFHYAKHPKSFVSLDDADHLLSKASDAAYAADVIAGWASRYVTAENGNKPPTPSDGHVRASLGKQPYSVTLTVDGHTWKGDEPVDLGGADTGPTPMDHLLGALGSCTAITLRMYADRKKLSLDGADIKLWRDEAPHTDGGQRPIYRRIRLHGKLAESERQRLLEIAEKCPVHRLLSQGAGRILTELENTVEASI